MTGNRVYVDELQHQLEIQEIQNWAQKHYNQDFIIHYDPYLISEHCNLHCSLLFGKFIDEVIILLQYHYGQRCICNNATAVYSQYCYISSLCYHLAQVIFASFEIINKNHNESYNLTYLTYSLFASWLSDRDASAISTIYLVSDFHWSRSCASDRRYFKLSVDFSDRLSCICDSSLLMITGRVVVGLPLNLFSVRWK